jgi:acid phosphatase
LAERLISCESLAAALPTSLNRLDLKINYLARRATALIKRFAFAGFILSFVLVLQCSAQQAVAPGHATVQVAPLAPGESILNLDVIKDRLKQYHDCKRGCYTKDLDLQADRAIAFLRKRAAHRITQSDQKLAMVFDIDETTLSNYEEMVKSGFAYDSKVFNAWVQAAAAPAIPATIRIYSEAQKRDVAIFFITGRPEDQRAATEQNLHSQGFDNWKQLVLRSPSQKSLTALEYKSAARAEIASQGYKIVLNVGDQWSDLRGKPQAEYSVKYPDPYYFLK